MRGAGLLYAARHARLKPPGVAGPSPAAGRPAPGQGFTVIVIFALASGGMNDMWL